HYLLTFYVPDQIVSYFIGQYFRRLFAGIEISNPRTGIQITAHRQNCQIRSQRRSCQGQLLCNLAAGYRSMLLYNLQYLFLPAVQFHGLTPNNNNYNTSDKIKKYNETFALSKDILYNVN